MYRIAVFCGCCPAFFMCRVCSGAQRPNFIVFFQRLKRALIRHDADVLDEGPDWWKNEPERRRRTEAAPLPPGKDDTGSFGVVKGARFEGTGGEFSPVDIRRIRR